MLKRYFLNQKKRNFSTASIWIKGGSDMDSIGKKGINKILCSLLTRGCEGFDNYVLSEFIESHGAELNQEVFEDGISISLKSLNEHFSKLLPLIDLIINKPILSEVEFQKVKKSSFDLIKKDKENPFIKCFENWRKIVYSNHPYAFSTIGNANDVSKINYEDILFEFKNFKSRDKFIISNNSEIKGENLKTLNQKNQKEKPCLINSDLDTLQRFDSASNESYQTIMMIGNQTCSRRSNEYLPFKVLESYLSYGMSAALFKIFREKYGITYDLGVFNPVRSGNAPFLIYLSVSNKNALFAFELLSSLWKNLLLNPLSDNEIVLAKEKLKGSFLLNDQSLDEILQRKIQLLSYGIQPNSENYLNSKIEEISSLDILELTKKYFSKPFLSISGNKKICSTISDLWKKNF
ncbi:insulinase family protein [Prochlorococcus marinus str. MU1404]|uniref:M16 family metallopeptidase n=1 Tax=Prochlorococcus marinus TaxID=1219 RepID=UPI001ADD350D|nr:pitrilysin family protein [Prochlorococcus marinus]MBO8229973.1 insulinase family protein [Prochlorococcus marinus XMU1404]MBW3073252.1 insulinase family protein [Prochlorococcus marinus str. MU1404]MCR8545690.1 insulinase family protein [Prochlorococcus marinus CUG1432]